jgi:cell shape-determining protein MreD
MINQLENTIVLLSPFFCLLVLIAIAIKLVKWAKRQVVAAVIVGALFQVILPDPLAEVTIETVQIVREEHQKKNTKRRTPKEETRRR